MKTRIAIRHSLHLLLALLALAPLASFAAEYPSLREALRKETPVNPATFKISNEVVVFDLWKYFEKAGITDTQERGDVVYFVVALQGIVNRERPRLYLLTTLALFEMETHGYPGIYKGPHPDMQPTNLDAFWLKEFEKKGYLSSVRKTDDLAELIKGFRKDVKGLSLWELKVPATVNAALMAAGCDSLLPVSGDLGKGRLRAWLCKEFPDLQVKMDLTNRFNGKVPIKLDDGRTTPSTGSAKNDVYRFAIEKWLKTGQTDPSYFWYDCDAIMLGSMRNVYCPPIYGKLGNQAEFQHNGMFNGDYWISRRAFVFDLMPWRDRARMTNRPSPPEETSRLGTTCWRSPIINAKASSASSADSSPGGSNTRTRAREMLPENGIPFRSARHTTWFMTPTRQWGLATRRSSRICRR